MNAVLHPHADAPAKTWEFLTIGAWFGLVTGLVEGVGLFIVQSLGWMNWRHSWQFGVSLEIIWISTAFCLVVFLGLGLGAALIGLLVDRKRALQLAVFGFALWMFLDWLALTGRVTDIGVLMLSLGLAVTTARWFGKHETAARRFWARTLPWLAGIAVLTFVGIQGGIHVRERRAIAELPTARSGAPNILVIVVDTLRADHLSSFGYPRQTSPNLDRLATLGTSFQKAISPTSWTLPAHASMLTGRYTYEHGTDGTEGRKVMDGRFPTIAEALRSRGYRTAAFSGNNYVFGRREGFGRGFIRFDDYFSSISDMAVRTVVGRKMERFFRKRRQVADIPGRRWADNVNASALQWMQRDSDLPFFAFLNYLDVHDPYLPPQPYRSKFSKQENPGGLINTLLDSYYPELTAEQLQGEVDAYDGAISFVDEHIGKLIAELEKKGLLENTIVVITSDHGESFGEHGLLHHRNALYREVTHVPLMVLWRGHIPAGRQVQQPVTTASLPATLMELLGEPGQRTFPVPSLVPLWSSDAVAAEWPYPLSELAQFPFDKVKRDPAYSGELKALVSPQWHFITHAKNGDELYDWQADPQELNNRAATPEGQPATSDFHRRLRDQLAGGKNARAQR